MKLLFLPPHRSACCAEAAEVFGWLGFELQRKGHAVHFFCGGTEPEQQTSGKKAEWAGIFRHVQREWKLWRACQRERYDVILVSGSIQASPLARLAQQRGMGLPEKTRLVSWLHACQTISPGLSPKISAFNDPAADRVCLTSLSRLQAYQTAWPTEAHRFFYLPHGVADCYYALTDRLPSWPESQSALCLSPPPQEKAQWALLAGVLAQLTEKAPGFSLSLLQPPGFWQEAPCLFPPEIEQSVQRLALPPDQNAEIALYRSHGLYWHLQPDVSLALLKAMAGGLGIVAVDAPDLRPLLRHYENALLIPTATAEQAPALANALVQSISHLLEEPALCAQLGRQAHDTVACYATWSQVADLLEAQLLQAQPEQPKTTVSTNRERLPDAL